MLENKLDLFTAALIFLVGLGSFGLGRLSAIWPERDTIRIGEPSAEGQMTKEPSITNESKSTLSALGAGLSAKGKYVASKSGKYYHLPWCPGALRIKEQNKIWFKTKEAAEEGGYKPASNCPGL